ncbi:MAG: lysophospholipid acyltransferase family protein [Actinomycetota bacterium]
MAEPVYRSVIGGVLAMIKTMRWKVIISGEEHIPTEGPAILATNHIGHLDFIFSGFAARGRGRLVRFLAKQEIFDKAFVGWLMRKMRHVPVDRFGAAKDSLDTAIDALRRGEIIGMFPEATISPSFVPRAGKTGTVRMAQITGAPLIPAAVWGTHRIITKWRPRNMQRGVAIMVNIGAPIDLSPDENPEAATARLMDRIRELLQEAQSSYPQTPAGPEDRWWLPAHLGGTAPTPEEAEVRLEEEQRAKAARRARAKDA